MIAWMRDRRGSVDVIQFVLILPIFVLMFYGFFEVWRVVSVKQSLDAGTYQAARCLSVYFHYGGDEARVRCEKVLRTELANNSLIDEDDLLDLRIKYYDAREREIEDLTRLPCNELFTVRAGLELPWTTVIPYLSSRCIVLVGQHTSYIECGPSWAPAPTPTPTATPVSGGE